MHAFGFFRPYTTDRGGVAPEPWHLSYAPVARQRAAAFIRRALREVLAAADIEGKAEVLAALDAQLLDLRGQRGRAAGGGAAGATARLRTLSSSPRLS